MRQRTLLLICALWMLILLQPTNAKSLSVRPDKAKDSSCNSNPIEMTWETDDSKQILFMSIPDEEIPHIPDAVLYSMNSGEFIQGEDMEFPKDFCEQLGICFPYTLKAGHYKVSHATNKYIVSIALN